MTVQPPFGPDDYNQDPPGYPILSMLPQTTLSKALKQAAEDVAWQVAREGGETVCFVIAVQTTDGIWHTAQGENLGPAHGHS